jgi:hypothetical protein
LYQADVGRIWNFSFYLLIVICTCDLAYLLTCWSDVFQDLMEFSNFTFLSLLLNCIIALASFVPHVLCRHSSFNKSFFMFWLNLAHVTIAVSTSSFFFFFFLEGDDQFVWFMMFDATFNNISVISWWSVLLVEETGENHRPVTSHWLTLSHTVGLGTPRLSG